MSNREDSTFHFFKRMNEPVMFASFTPELNPGNRGNHIFIVSDSDARKRSSLGDKRV